MKYMSPGRELVSSDEDCKDELFSWLANSNLDLLKFLKLDRSELWNLP